MGYQRFCTGGTSRGGNRDLRRQLEHKEASLKRLQAFLRSPSPQRTSLTQEIVTVRTTCAG